MINFLGRPRGSFFWPTTPFNNKIGLCARYAYGVHGQYGLKVFQGRCCNWISIVIKFGHGHAYGEKIKGENIRSSFNFSKGYVYILRTILQLVLFNNICVL